MNKVEAKKLLDIFSFLVVKKLIKTVLVALFSFIAVSGLLIWIGYSFNLEWLMFRFYEETAAGFEAGGSVIAFIVGLICSYIIGTLYNKMVA